jgi:hypothetical protein
MSRPLWVDDEVTGAGMGERAGDVGVEAGTGEPWVEPAVDDLGVRVGSLALRVPAQVSAATEPGITPTVRRPRLSLC